MRFIWIVGSPLVSKSQFPDSRLFTRDHRHERIVRSGGSQISASTLIYILSFLVALSFVIAANVWFYSMANEVNERLPKNAQIDAGMRHNMYEVFRLHSQMYPESPKRWQM